MNRYLRIIVLAALALAPLPLQGQQAPAARIAAARQRAEAAGIPVSLLESRIAEGRAKNVPLERIAAAVERRADALLQAKESMSRSARRLSAADLAAGADAVEAGVGGEALRAVIDQAHTDDRPVAIAVLTYLHREHGIPVGEALAQVQHALRQGPDALRTLPAQAASRARHGSDNGHGRGQGGAEKGRRPGGGVPEALPTPGRKPGAGKPPGKGPPGEKPGKGKPSGTPGGKPGGGV